MKTYKNDLISKQIQTLGFRMNVIKISNEKLQIYNKNKF